MNYTKIKIKTASNHLTEDLWINSSLPTDIKYMEYVNSNSRELGVLFFIVISCLASFFAGMIVYHKDRPSMIGFFSYGSFNLLSIIGFAYASDILKINERFTREKKTERKSPDLKKIGKQSMIISAVITFLLLFLPVLGALSASSDVLQFALPMIISTFIFISIFLFPFINLFYNNQKLLLFLILFSLFFFTFSIFFQLGLLLFMRAFIAGN